MKIKEILAIGMTIAILIALGLIFYQDYQRLLRDRKMKAELERIRSVLEMYRADKGNYPQASGEVGSVLSLPLADYLELPLERNYYYNGQGSTYKLCSSPDCHYQTTNP